MQPVGWSGTSVCDLDANLWALTRLNSYRLRQHGYRNRVLPTRVGHGNWLPVLMLSRPFFQQGTVITVKHLPTAINTYPVAAVPTKQRL
jgi:hypothetical protein